MNDDNKQKAKMIVAVSTGIGLLVIVALTILFSVVSSFAKRGQENAASASRQSSLQVAKSESAQQASIKSSESQDSQSSLIDSVSQQDSSSYQKKINALQAKLDKANKKDNSKSGK